jgi:hypothetical protein
MRCMPSPTDFLGLAVAVTGALGLAVAVTGEVVVAHGLAVFVVALEDGASNHHGRPAAFVGGSGSLQPAP